MQYLFMLHLHLPKTVTSILTFTPLWKSHVLPLFWYQNYSHRAFNCRDIPYSFWECYSWAGPSARPLEIKTWKTEVSKQLQGELMLHLEMGLSVDSLRKQNSSISFHLSHVSSNQRTTFTLVVALEIKYLAPCLLFDTGQAVSFLSFL